MIIDKSEARLQQDLWEWAWNTYPQFRRQMWAVPNGLKLNPVQANIAKATGTLAGVWDLHVFNLGTFHIIETKIGNNQLTVDRIINSKKVFGQKEWGELMAKHGAVRHLYRTLEEGQGIYKDIFRIGSYFQATPPTWID
jgi:hypothetical protein